MKNLARKFDRFKSYVFLNADELLFRLLPLVCSQYRRVALSIYCALVFFLFVFVFGLPSTCVSVRFVLTRYTMSSAHTIRILCSALSLLNSYRVISENAIIRFILFDPSK